MSISISSRAEPSTAAAAQMHQTSPETSTMLTRRHLLLTAVCAAIASPAFAADQTAQQFVTAIYAAYKGKHAKGILLTKERDIRRYFAPALAALIIKDREDAAKRNEVGALDGDPFIDAQDWEISSFDIAVSEPAPGKAVATVKFTNDTPKVVVLDLVKLKNEWRISEIIWRRENNKSEALSSIFGKP
jgi:hypothetical protein